MRQFRSSVSGRGNVVNRSLPQQQSVDRSLVNAGLVNWSIPSRKSTDLSPEPPRLHAQPVSGQPVLFALHRPTCQSRSSLDAPTRGSRCTHLEGMSLSGGILEQSSDFDIRLCFQMDGVEEFWSVSHATIPHLRRSCEIGPQPARPPVASASTA